MSYGATYLHSDITDSILKCAFRVHNKLGAGIRKTI